MFKIFLNIAVLLYFWSNKYSLGEHETFFQIWLVYIFKQNQEKLLKKIITAIIWIV